MKKYIGLLTLFLGIGGISQEICGFDSSLVTAAQISAGILLAKVGLAALQLSSPYWLETYHIPKELLGGEKPNLLTIVNKIKNEKSTKIGFDCLSKETADLFKDRFDKERAALKLTNQDMLVEAAGQIMGAKDGNIIAWKVEEFAVKEGQKPYYEVTLLRENSLKTAGRFFGLGLLATGIGLVGHGFYKVFKG